MIEAVQASADHPILIDKFLKDAIEIDVDAICDGTTVVLGGIMQHIEEAGIHSGDSACVLPAHGLTPAMLTEIKEATRAMALELGVIGLMNVQYAVKDHTLYIIEVNPRASRTVPFVSKATGVPLAKLATKVMAGMTLQELEFTEEVTIDHYAVKEAVFPFDRFDNVDTLLGPEMKSTGEVMGIDHDLGLAFAKSQYGAGQPIPSGGTILISVRDNDKEAILPVARDLESYGFAIVGTKGTAAFLQDNGVKCTRVYKISEGRPHLLDKIHDEDIQWIINTSMGTRTKDDSFIIRRAALKYHLPYTTTITGAVAMAQAIASLRKQELEVKSVQEYF